MDHRSQPQWRHPERTRQRFRQVLVSPYEALSAPEILLCGGLFESLKNRGLAIVFETFGRPWKLRSGDQRKGFRGRFHPRIPVTERLAQIAIHHLNTNLQ